ncbi:MAG: D-2-hydroxyacid dehydrogenase [Crocinitomicaceae bacterium]|nr:D-2-hydroxyacid dehydrogenase [Crocinitomicaceae bacterium]
MKILANDGIDKLGQQALEQAGYLVLTTKVPQEGLIDYINHEGISGLLVRSATTARKDLIDACPGLKFIGRGGVGIDNIDADYAREKGIAVFNTPASSGQSVAELVISLMFAAARGIYDAGGLMPSKGAVEFDSLKKKYGRGTELRGKTLGIVGFGRIGQTLARYALGSGMKVLVFDSFEVKHSVELQIEGYGTIEVPVPVVSFNELLSSSDYISLHVPKQPNGNSVIGKNEFKHLKKGVVLINTSRGGVIDEAELIRHLDEGIVSCACLDVFINEPHPSDSLLKHPKIIATPHIGAATLEAQERIGLEIASSVADIMKNRVTF